MGTEGRRAQGRAWGALLALVVASALVGHSQGMSLGGLSLGIPLRWPAAHRRVSACPQARSAQEVRCRDELQRLRQWHASLQAAQMESDENVASAAASAQSTRGTPGAQGAAGPGGVRRLLSGASSAALSQELQQRVEELQRLSTEVKEKKEELKRLTYIKSRQDYNLTKSRVDFSDVLLTPKVMGEARALIRKCNGHGWVLPQTTPTWKGYACSADDSAIAQYLTYKEHGVCPDDWPSTQNMIFVNNCFALPKRRCLTLTAPTWKEPVPFPQSLFDQEALIDENVRWTRHECKSYECLNTRLLGDCRNCFMLFLEKRRWRRAYRGSLPMHEVIAMKNGSLRIGLDAGGGSGSFAAHMATYGVTVMTTAMNIETVKGRSQGLPYMESIALRGLIPLHVPHKSRLPLFDNTLDIIHCVNSVKYLPMIEFEELLFEWDRVLRVGGIMWFEMFYAPIEEMPIYLALIEQLGYKKLHWNILPKPDFGERAGIHVYLNCVIEKPVRPDAGGNGKWGLFG